MFSLLTFKTCGEIRLRVQVTEGLRGFVLDYFMLQLDMPLQGSLRAVEPRTTYMRAGETIENVAVAAPLQFFR
jgi:hypothetical protein